MSTLGQSVPWSSVVSRSMLFSIFWSMVRNTSTTLELVIWSLSRLYLCRAYVRMKMKFLEGPSSKASLQLPLIDHSFFFYLITSLHIGKPEQETKWERWPEAPSVILYFIMTELGISAHLVVLRIIEDQTIYALSSCRRRFGIFMASNWKLSITYDASRKDFCRWWNYCVHQLGRILRKGLSL